MEPAAPSYCMEDPTKTPTDEANRVKKKLTTTELETIAKGLRSWYYSEGDGGNGIFLSDAAGKVYREALKAVLDASTDNETEEATRQVVDKLSTLRSKTKTEIAVYGRREE
jgi:hypothetical protein